MSAPLHVLIVPSWYPTPAVPNAGNFVRAQIVALRRHEPDCAVSVWNFQPQGPRPSLKRPRQLLAAWQVWRRRAPAHWVEHEDGHRECIDPFFFLPAPWHRRRPGLPRRLSDLLARLAREGRAVSLLHAHVAEPAGWACGEVAEAARLPWVLTEHMGLDMLTDLSSRGRLPPALVRAYQRCTDLVAVSRWHAATLEQRCGRLGRVLPNTVDETAFPLAAQPLDDDAPFLAVASLTPIKRLDVLLDAYDLARARKPMPRLHIVGDGPLRNRLEARARALGLTDAVRFLGARDQAGIRTELHACRALVLSSDAESFGVVVVEALLAGRFVISTACGGPEDILDPTTGALVPAGNESALAQALLDFHPSRHEPRALRQYAIDRFGTRVIARRLRALYEQVTSVATCAAS